MQWMQLSQVATLEQRNKPHSQAVRLVRVKRATIVEAPWRFDLQVCAIKRKRQNVAGRRKAVFRPVASGPVAQTGYSV